MKTIITQALIFAGLSTSIFAETKVEPLPPENPAAQAPTQPIATPVVKTKEAPKTQAKPIISKNSKDTRVCLHMTQQAFNKSKIDTLYQKQADVISFFQRYMKYTISHEEGFIATDVQCDEVLSVELYPIAEGWSVFARYTGTSTEESIDKLRYDEVKSYSERVVQSLLYKKDFSSTINRYNVLSSDSHKKLRKIKGESQAFFAMGMSPRLAKIGKDSESRNWVASNPFIARMGNKYSYDRWSVQVHGHLGINLNKNSILAANKQGEVKFAGEGGLGVQFLYTPAAKKLTGIYYGAGGTMKVQSFTAFGEYHDQSLYGGGLDVDLVTGYEFFRASGREVFVQLEANLPTYVIQARKGNGYVDSWTPASTLIVGLNF